MTKLDLVFLEFECEQIEWCSVSYRKFQTDKNFIKPISIFQKAFRGYMVYSELIDIKAVLVFRNIAAQLVRASLPLSHWSKPFSNEKKTTYRS